MDFIIEMKKMQGKDSIFIMLDWLTKFDYFYTIYIIYTII